MARILQRGRGLNLGERLRQVREKHGYTLSKVAEEAGISKAYLSQLERGHSDRPSSEILERVAAVLGTSRDDLVEGTLPPHGPFRPSGAPARRPDLLAEDLLYAALMPEILADVRPQNVRDVESVAQERMSSALQALEDIEALEGTWWMYSPEFHDEPVKLHRVELERDQLNLSARMYRVEPEEDRRLEWKFQGRVQGRDIVGIYYTANPRENPLSYGTVQLRRAPGREDTWIGSYGRLNITELSRIDDAWVQVPVTLQRQQPEGR